MDEVARDSTPIQRFYKDKNIFITGGTGFLGKILIEKLLRSTEVGTIYILIRDKKGKDVHARIDELLDDMIFTKLHQFCPKYKHKIQAIPGDCSLAGLGLGISDRQILIKKVNVVFHVAATVKFDEKLNLAYAINVSGTRAILDLCFEIENLKALMHVSTAYANCHLPKIGEEFYDYPINYEDVGELLNKLDAQEIDANVTSLLGKWPNTYAFTKALAEALIKEKCRGLPVGVFRPAIVVSTYKEPMVGWIDNFYGPTGVIAAAASGLLRTLLCNNSTIADIVPVDMCVAGLIAAGWEVATQTDERIAENVKIYNYVSSVEKPLKWYEFHQLVNLYGREYPLKGAIWALMFHMSKWKLVHSVRQLTMHLLPAAICDLYLVITGQKPKLFNMYRKVHKFTKVIEYFSTRNWAFSNGNVQSLYERLEPCDKALFPMSIKNLHWLGFFKTYVQGIRLYLIKEPWETLADALKKQKRFEMIHFILKYALSFVTVNFLWNLIYRVIKKSITN